MLVLDLSTGFILSAIPGQVNKIKYNENKYMHDTVYHLKIQTHTKPSSTLLLLQAHISLTNVKPCLDRCTCTHFCHSQSASVTVTGLAVIFHGGMNFNSNSKTNIIIMNCICFTNTQKLSGKRWLIDCIDLLSFDCTNSYNTCHLMKHFWRTFKWLNNFFHV